MDGLYEYWCSLYDIAFEKNTSMLAPASALTNLSVELQKEAFLLSRHKVEYEASGNHAGEKTQAVKTYDEKAFKNYFASLSEAGRSVVEGVRFSHNTNANNLFYLNYYWSSEYEKDPVIVKITWEELISMLDEMTTSPVAWILSGTTEEMCRHWPFGVPRKTFALDADGASAAKDFVSIKNMILSNKTKDLDKAKLSELYSNASGIVRIELLALCGGFPTENFDSDKKSMLWEVFEKISSEKPASF